MLQIEVQRHQPSHTSTPCISYRAIKKAFRRSTIARATLATSQARRELKATEKGRQLRQCVRQALQPVKHCGLFGLQEADLDRVKEAVAQLEAENPLHCPTEHLHMLAGQWTVLFSTIKVTGSRRVKLGLRDLVNIGTLSQSIDAATQTAVNRVGFNVPAFGVRNGEMILQAAYEVVSPTRVAIALKEASLVPERLQSIFESNFDLLLSIFNPGGHLDITYCDDEMRCGRDDKGNVFVLERLTGTGQEA